MQCNIAKIFLCLITGLLFLTPWRQYSWLLGVASEYSNTAMLSETIQPKKTPVKKKRHVYKVLLNIF